MVKRILNATPPMVVNIYGWEFEKGRWSGRR